MRLAPLCLLVATLMATACSGRKESSNGSLATDSTLATDLREAADTAAFSEAADVSMRVIPPDSTLPMPPSRPMTASPSAAPTMRTGAAKTPAPSAPARPAPAATPAPATTPSPMRPTPPHPVPIPVNPPAVLPAPSAPERPVSAEGASGDYPTPACASPASADQRRCLLAYLARSDVTLDRNYQARIARLRSEAGTGEGAPDPESVERLRTAQRAWLVYRDTECRNRNRGHEGALWAPVRARCLAEFSQARAEELAH
jgi:uncharacterized protein YecT (DUF1311 family)